MSALLRSAWFLLPILLTPVLQFVTAFPSAPALAQGNRLVLAPGDLNETEQDYNGIFLPSDRTLSQGIQRARKLIAEGEYSRAIRFLDEVLDPKKEDSFVVVRNQGEIVGLKSAARQILRDLPADGRQSYTSTFGPVANRELRSAVAEGNPALLRRVAQRYFYTPAGYEASLLLAAHEADMGRHFSAGLVYQQLLETPEAVARLEPQLSILAATSWLAAGDPQRARSVIEALDNQGFKSIRIAGEEHQINFADRQPLKWLQRVVGTPTVTDVSPEQQWLTHRGNPARNGQVEGGLPHMRVRWRVRLLENHKLESLHDQFLNEFMQSEQSMPVAASPLAVGDYIITRSAHNLRAVDFRSGKLVWEVQPQSRLAFDNSAGNSTASRENEQNANSTRSFASRIWQDHLYSSISSDGQRVYAIRDLHPPKLNQIDTFGIPAMRGRQILEGSAESNRLCAFELATQGKLVWELDGAAEHGELQGAFFLGAPLSIGHSLYCLIEVKSAIYLAAIDPQTGQLQWRQQLANLETGILLDSQRRLQASIPSYEAGILVCPTGAGVVVGVDLAKLAFAWAYRYETNRDPMVDFRMRGRSQIELNSSTWIDSSAILSGGRVLLTPPESDALHCLDLLTGKLLWKQHREDRLFVAGVYQDLALLIGNHHLTALHMTSGDPAWQESELNLPIGSVPTGRGFFSQGKYFLPLSSAEVFSVDVESGVVVDRATARGGQSLGNLICHRGAVLSQSGLNLDRYDQIEVLRNESEVLLARDPANVEALRTLGEIAYNEGRLAKAIELLERAHQSSAEDVRTREVLSESLVIALDEDFASYREYLPLLRELQANSSNGRLTLLRLEAHGLLEIGDPVGSFESCLKLYLAEESTNEVLSIGRNHHVDVTRWLRAQISEIWSKANTQEREKISELVSSQIEQLPDQPGNGVYLRLVESMGTLDLVDPVAMRLAKYYEENGRSLAAQQLFMRLVNANNEKLRTEAVARSSLALHQLGLPRLSQQFDELLRSSLANVPCLDGKTGSQCLEEWGTHDSFDARSEDGAIWPYGEVEISKESPRNTGGARTINPVLGVRIERGDSVLGRCNVMFSPRRSEIIVRDSSGKEFYRAPLADQGRLQLGYQSNVYAVTRGNLLLVSLGDKLVAFDTFSSTENGIGEALWRIDVASPVDNHSPFRSVSTSREEGRPGTHRASRSQQNGKWIGVIGPLTHDSCVFQSQHRLVCVDPLTGKERWTRNGVPEGCDLYGDEEFILAVPRDSNNAQVFRTADGRSMGEATVPPWEEQLATIGRQVIRWQTRKDGQQVLSSFDTISGETDWKREFHPSARVDIAMNRFVAVVDKEGLCVIVDATDGKLVVEEILGSMPKIRDIYLLAGSTDFVLALQRQIATEKPTQSVNALNQADYVVLEGLIYVFDRTTGNSLWPRPAEVRQESFMLTQPVDTPVLAFVGNMQRRNSRGSRPSIRMLLLEKSSGRLLYSDDELLASAANHCHIQAHGPDTDEVLIELASQSIRLKFTHSHRPPEPPAMSDVNTAGKTSQNGLLGIFRKAFGGE